MHSPEKHFPTLVTPAKHLVAKIAFFNAPLPLNLPLNSSAFKILLFQCASVEVEASETFRRKIYSVKIHVFQECPFVPPNQCLPELYPGVKEKIGPILHLPHLHCCVSTGGDWNNGPVSQQTLR